MSEPTRGRGASVRAVGDRSRLHLAPVLDALLTLLTEEGAPRWVGARTDPAGCVLRMAPGLLVSRLAATIEAAAREGYVLSPRRTVGADMPRLGCLRDDPKNDDRVQALAQLIGASVQQALPNITPQDLLHTDRDRDALRTLLHAHGAPLPGVEVEAPCERFELSVARQPRERRRASALVFLLEETIDLREARTQLLYAVRIQRERSGIDPALLGALDAATFDEPDGQLRRFLDFLLDRGLARVHADVGIELLARVAAIAAVRQPLDGADEFVEYVRRVQLLRETLDLDDQLVEDRHGLHRLADYVRTIRFVRHLPLAIVHDEQRFERRGTDTILRRVTYRARLNGTRPTPRGACPIEDACVRFEAALANGETPEAQREYRRLLPRMLALALVAPQGQELDAARFRAETGAWIARLEGATDFAEPRQALLVAVRGARERIERARGCFLTILRRHHAELSARWSSEARRVHLSVRRSLFDPLGDATRPLREEERGRAPTDDFGEASLRRDLYWLGGLHVSSDGQVGSDSSGQELTGVMVVGCRLSLVHLHEPAATRMHLQRDMPERLLQVILAEVPPSNDLEHLTPVALPRRIVLGLPGELMSHPPPSKMFQDEHRRRREREDGIRWAVTALVAHLALRAILEWVRAHSGERALPAPHVVLLRAHRTDGRVRERDWSFTAGEAFTALGRALEQALGATSLVAGVTSQGIVLPEPKPPATRQQPPSDLRFRIRATNWATTSRWPLRIREGFGAWAGGGEGERVGLITVVSRPLHDGPDRHLVLGETATAAADSRGGFTFVGGPRIAEVLDGDPAEAMLGCLRAERNRLQRAGCGLILLLTHRHGSARIGRLREFERLESSALLDAMRQADGECVTLCPISYGVFSAVRLRTTRVHAARVFVVSDAGSKDRLDLQEPGATAAPEALVPFFSVATFKVVGTDDDTRPQSGIATYSLALSSGDARVRADTEHAVLSPSDQWHGRIRDVLLATHFFVTEKEVHEGDESDEPGGFVGVLAPHEAIDTTEAADVGELVVQSSRGRSVRLSLAALLADANRAVEPAR